MSRDGSAKIDDIETALSSGLNESCLPILLMSSLFPLVTLSGDSEAVSGVVRDLELEFLVIGLPF